ncbi:TetR/AcrR family transcriptional regulator [Nocardioides humi]|uniref:TetR/AcrR family transcriptional regulator n=1 Tax=Nocardioides humi TaxID=449461 RepID=UPI0024824CA1|nr:TetR/AcrR family transcriptional regulator [Nocardioides humi]
MSRNRQQERSDTSTRLLLEAAGDLISEVGYAGMTLAAVGERAGYSRGIVTIKFGSKANLLAAVVDRITSGWSHKRWLPEIKDKNGLDGFLALIKAISDEFERDTRGVRLLYALMFEAVQSREEGLREQFVEWHRAYRADLADILRRGIKDGSVRSGIVVEDEAAAVISGLRGIGYQWIIDPLGFAAVPALRHLYESTEARLRPLDDRS